MLKKILTGLICVTLLSGCTGYSTTGAVVAETTTNATASGEIIYVDGSATGSGDGSSWNKAFDTLNDALEVSEDGDEIWVAEGTYTPSESSREESFTMIDGVDVYGGFSGTETNRDQRSWGEHETILSGEIGDSSSKEDNIKNIVIAANSVIDGFTITGGYSVMQGPPNGEQPPSGEQPPGEMPSGDSAGGSSVGHMSPESILSGDATTTDNGAAIVIWETSPTIQNCRILDNSASKGGAVYIVNTEELDEQPKFINCYIANNYAGGRGGAISIDLSASAVFIDSIFENNVCDGKGGAIYNDFGCSPLLENCLLIGNEAQSGGALGNDGASNPVISNTTFYGNIAYETGAALYQGSGPFNDPVVVNSIIWNNFCEEDVASVYNWNECNTKIEYSIVEGGYVGTGNLDEDPSFVDADINNFDLSENSVALFANSTSGRIGYDSQLTGERTADDITEIITMLYAIEKNEEPIALDLTNDKTSADVQDIGDVVYVIAGGSGNGSSWSKALGSLQEAIDLANVSYTESGETVDIFVAEGTYYTGNVRSDSIILREGLNIYGGFNGTEAALAERNIENNTTILSGDIGIDGDTSDNSYHVLIGSNDVVLDGFTITGGNADKVDGEVYDNKGGGLLNYNAGNRVVPHYTPVLGFDTVIKNCIFVDNQAVEGGASYTYHGGNPVFENVDFVDNTSDYGGAILDRAGTNSTYTDCLFEDNTANYKGGAAFVDYGSMATFESCEFNDNNSGTAGGAIYIVDRASQAITNETDIVEIDPTWELSTDIYSSVLVENSLFSDNTAGSNGGAVYVYESSNAKIVDTDFIDNKALLEGNDIGVYYESTLYVDTLSTFDGITEASIFIEDGSTIIAE